MNPLSTVVGTGKYLPVLFIMFYIFSLSFSSPLTANLGLVFVQYSQSDLPPLKQPLKRPRFEPGTGGLVAGTLTSRTPHLSLDHHTSP